MDDDASAGVPEWVVTYGDMMSLLLTFFIMLVSLSEIVADQKYRAIMEALQRYIGYRTSPKAPPGKRFPLNSLMQTLQTLGSPYREFEGYGGVRQEAPRGEEVRVFHTAQGMQVRVGEPIPFAPTAADLTPEALEQLEGIAEQTAGKPNKIEIIGHAAPDPLPKEAPVKDKLLLSYLRAHTVLLYLKNHGVDEIRLRIRAAGDTEPLPETGDEHSRRHDRVEIHILDKFADHYQGPRE